MPPNPAFADIFHTLLGLLLYFALFLPLSFGVCYFAQPFGFRRRSAFFRLCVAQALSFAVAPYLLFLLYRLTTPWLILLPAAGGMFLLLPALRRLRWRHLKPVLAITIVLAGATIILLTEWNIGSATYLSSEAGDHAWHVAVTHALTMDRVPPFNPGFAPGRPVLLFYHYFWYLSASTVEIVSGGLVTARNAVVAGTIYTALSLLATIVISAGLLFPGPRRRNRTRVWLSFSLLLVTGLDVVPSLTYFAWRWSQGAWGLPLTIEWWNEQVTSWTNTVLWVPHNTAILCVIWLLYWESVLVPAATIRRRWPIIVFRAVALVSAFGSAAWLFLVGVAVLAVWLVRQALRGNREQVREWLCAGLIAAPLVAPFLVDLLHARMNTASTISFSVRRFGPADSLLPSLGSAFTTGFLHQAILFLLLPLNYGLELGVFALAALLYWRFCHRTPLALRGGDAWWPLLATSALIATFVRSDIGNNDLGWRAFLPIQFALLLMLVLVWEEFSTSQRTARWRPLIIAFAATGLITTLSDLTLLRIAMNYPDPAGSKAAAAERAFSRREAYREINLQIPQELYVQHNPAIVQDFEQGLFGNRRVPVADYYYGSEFGVDKDLFGSTVNALTPVFRDCSAGAEDYANLIASNYQIRFWMFQNNDPAWRDPACWIRQRKPFYADNNVLVIPAGGN